MRSIDPFKAFAILCCITVACVCAVLMTKKTDNPKYSLKANVICDSLLQETSATPTAIAGSTVVPCANNKAVSAVSGGHATARSGR